MTPLQQLVDWYRRRRAPPPTYFLSRWLFLRLLGLVYLIAFISLWVQIEGLIGSEGVLPVRLYMPAFKRAFQQEWLHGAPTLCWLDTSDRFLHLQCAAGVLLSCLVVAGVAPALCLFLLWVLYLSLSVAGQIFLHFQWDTLLLETGLLAVLFAPPQLWPRLASEPPPARVTRWLLLWLLFRLMFCSGLVKRLSGDPTWRDWTAMQYHYETQPLPPWTAWYMHHLPARWQYWSVGFTFFVELVLPFLIFGPRWGRRAIFVVFVALQLLIIATGNYGFFNLLSIALCVPLLDDACFPRRWRVTPPSADADTPRRVGWPVWILTPFVAGVVLLSSMNFVDQCKPPRKRSWDWDPTLMAVREAAAPFRSVNFYGLFRVMTTRRWEIIIEGSNDGRTWLPYEFKWKPGDVQRRPAFTWFHMPRLDWQMWFAALDGLRREDGWLQNLWVLQFMEWLRRGSPQVLGLLEHNPFPDHPPRFVRAVVYDYHFTDAAQRAETGAWWRRQYLGYYGPALPVDEAPQQ